MSGGSALDRLAALAGILPRWRDVASRTHVTGAETRIALLAAMGIEAGTEAAAADSLAALTAAAAARLAPPQSVVAAGRRSSIPLSRPAAWRLALEDGDAIEGRGASKVALPPLAAGVHALTLDPGRGGETGEALVIAAPPPPPSVREATGRDRVWGVTAALYGLRSAHNLGLGDYADLGAAATGLAAHGADFLGVNPVHALAGGAEPQISPYSPIHRGFLNAAHVALDRIPEFAGSAPARAILAEHGAALAAARRGALVDYATVLPLHDAALRAVFETFRTAGGTADGTARRSDFEAWRRAEAGPLRDFTLYEAIAARHGADRARWPAEFAAPDAPGSLRLAAERPEALDFSAWRQWIAAAQLADAAAAARGAGMALGLYLDLAVGATTGGAEVWADPGAYASGVSLGVPPDDFSPAGQGWGLAPFSPPGLRAARYAPFRRVLRAAMRHAGLVRIDHALGLNRAFWVPSGAPGGYVRYPFDALLAIVAIEARRAGCVVIGEDLGSVPDGFRDRLAAAGLYGCAVTQFERDAKGGFRPPAGYRPKTLASFATHDTPTIAGWRAGREIDWRLRLGDLDADEAAAARADRRKAVKRLDAMTGPHADPVEAAHRALAGAASELVAVQLDDVFGRAEQQNLPGTVETHPNWRRRAPVAVRALASHPALKRTAGWMQDAGRGARADQEDERCR